MFEDGLKNKEKIMESVLSVSKKWVKKWGDSTLLKDYPIAYARIDSIIDTGFSFMSFATLVGSDKNDSIARVNILSGLALIKGRLCMLIANEPSIMAGAICSKGITKILRMMEIAKTQSIPIVYLIECSGLNLSEGVDSFVDIGSIFATMARFSKKGLPQCSICYGTSTAGGAYLYALADYTVWFDPDAKAFLAGPDLVASAIGERSTPEQLGGTLVHKYSGLVDTIVSDHEQVKDVVGKWLHNHLQWPCFEYTPKDKRNISHFKKFLAKMSADFSHPLNPLDLINVLVDKDFEIFKEHYGKNMICVFARINSYKVGIIANRAPIDVDAVKKSCQFLQKCDLFNIPLLFMMNTTGFMVGKNAEKDGIIVHGARLIQMITNIEQPKITLQIGAAFGAGYYAMCGRSFSPDFVFSWPNSKLSVMGAKQVAELLSALKTRSALRKGIILSSKQKSEYFKNIFAKYNKQMQAEYSSASLFDDGIIDPVTTRDVLIFCLEVFNFRKKINLQGSSYGQGRC